jgi:hypothetical protein
MSDSKVSVAQMQGFLLANTESLVDKARRNKPVREGLAGSNRGVAPPLTFLKTAVDPTQQNSSDTISDLMNAFSTPDQIDFVTDIPDEVRIQLKPKYKIFKTIVFDIGKRVNLELKTSITGENTLENQGVVVKNIEISNLGGNLEEINSNIEATITLYSTRLDNYFEKQYPGAIKNGEFSLPSSVSDIVSRGISWIDLLKLDLDDPDLAQLQESAKTANLANRETREQILSDMPLPYVHKESDQRIRLQVSYGDIQDIPGYTAVQMERMRRIIASQTETLELSLVANEIVFNPDGTSDLVIQYRGAHGTTKLDRVTDLLYDPYFSDMSLQLLDEIDILERIRDKGAAFAQNVENLKRVIRKHTTFDFFNHFDRQEFEQIISGEINTTSEDGTVNEDNVRKLDKLIENRQNKRDLIRKMQSGFLVRGLYGPTLSIIYNKTRRRTDDDWDYAGSSAAAFERLSRVSRLRAKIEPIISLDKIDIGGNQNKVDGPFNSSDFFLRGEAEEGNTQRENYESSIEGIVSGENASELDQYNSLLPEAESVDIDYIFFGDIIEVALEVLASNNRLGTGQKQIDTKIKTISPYFVVTDLSQFDRLRTTVVGSGKSTTDISDRYLKSYIAPFYSETGSPFGGQRLPSGATRATRIGQLRDNDVKIEELHELVGEIISSEISYKNPGNPNQTIKTNIANVPISMRLFSEWYYGELNGGTRTNLHLRDYLNQLVLFLRDVLAEEYNEDIVSEEEPPEPLINRIFVKSQRYDFLTPIQNKSREFSNTSVDISSIRALSNNISQNPNKYTKPITIISQAPDVEKTNRTDSNRRTVDKRGNVPHIIFGDATNGILQSINFSKIDMPGVREARLLEGRQLYYGEDFEGPNILSERYNATLELIGTTFFRPTSQLYLDPRPLELGYAKNVATPARLLGLGGYYRVIRVVQTLNFTGGATWNTTIESVWEDFGDGYSVGGSNTFLQDVNITSIVGRLALATNASQAPTESGDLIRPPSEVQDLVRRQRERARAHDPELDIQEESGSDRNIGDFGYPPPPPPR